MNHPRCLKIMSSPTPRLWVNTSRTKWATRVPHQWLLPRTHKRVPDPAAHKQECKMTHCFWEVFCQIWGAIGGHVARHAEGYGLGAGALGLAVVKNWPPVVPKSLQDWWTWARGSAQTAL